MRKMNFKKFEKLQTFVLLVLCVSVLCLSDIKALNSNDGNVDVGGGWNGEDEYRSLVLSPISINQSTQYLTIQDSNPVNTITVKITSHETGAVVFENVYPQGQTNFIVIPLTGWTAGGYTIELFGRENNGYLVGTFQILP